MNNVARRYQTAYVPKKKENKKQMNMLQLNSNSTQIIIIWATEAGN